MMEDKEPTRELTDNRGLESERKALMAEGAMDILKQKKGSKKTGKRSKPLKYHQLK